ncbi:cAMP phosphodiesterases class-II-domain-containing protein [Trametes polyzona]|nr:cAMP phosphodiesterases class-II-domain-containing protein [Trametes polyzona]
MPLARVTVARVVLTDAATVSGGGPYEDNLSSYLLKMSGSRWQDGIVALEAGSGLGALNRLLAAHPDVFMPRGPEEDDNDDSPVAIPTAADVYAWIQCYLITHPHLDHINGLVLSAGSTKGPPKTVRGTRETLEVIADVFSGKVWPALASWVLKPNAAYILSPLTLDEYVSLTDDIDVRTFPLSHGAPPGSPLYASSAFALRHVPTARELLFLGDVEPDSVSAHPQNAELWRAAAPKIPHALAGIFIECSWPAGRAESVLYGHLSPPHLVDELTVLAREVVASRERARASGGGGDLDTEESDEEDQPRKRRRKRVSDPDVDLRGALDGLRVFITHCKDDLHHEYDRPIHEVIAGQVRELVEERELGAEIVAVEQGMLICTSPLPPVHTHISHRLCSH